MVDEVVPAAQLMARAHTLAEEWITAGRQRVSITNGDVAKLKEINRKESEDLANALISADFVRAQSMAAQKRGQVGLSWILWLVEKSQPLWSKL
jgi:enoyl-CoA hydratase/carnithine racemase